MEILPQNSEEKTLPTKATLKVLEIMNQNGVRENLLKQLSQDTGFTKFCEQVFKYKQRQEAEIKAWSQFWKFMNNLTAFMLVIQCKSLSDRDHKAPEKLILDQKQQTEFQRSYISTLKKKYSVLYEKYLFPKSERFDRSLIGEIWYNFYKRDLVKEGNYGLSLLIDRRQDPNLIRAIRKLKYEIQSTRIKNRVYNPFRKFVSCNLTSVSLFSMNKNQAASKMFLENSFPAKVSRLTLGNEIPNSNPKKIPISIYMKLISRVCPRVHAAPLATSYVKFYKFEIKQSQLRKLFCLCSNKTEFGLTSCKIHTETTFDLSKPLKTCSIEILNLNQSGLTELSNWGENPEYFENLLTALSNSPSFVESIKEMHLNKVGIPEYILKKMLKEHNLSHVILGI
ncbi:unnamed protein product [Moneuplotes crassus]|uniref:Uncharacterized protein n=1 Tax=Euplotes crassus TaxID=5936 RepID=A0AAD1XCK8_EUPCR|nr:unnamed protein product [Moneuplotes crassus]